MNKKEYKENIRKELKETFPNEIEHIWSFGYCNRIDLKDDKYYEKVLNFLKSNNSIYKDIKNYCSMIQFDIIIPEEIKSDIDKEIELLENKLKELKLKRKNKLILLIAALAILCILPLFVDSYISGILCRIFLYATLAGSLNVINGYSGQMNIGHAGFVCFGAYTGGILATKLNAPFLIQLLAGGLTASIAAFFLSKPILRLKGIYLAIITMGFCEITRIVTLNWTDFT